MKCMGNCGRDLPESEIEESHDVPKYLFKGDKNRADKFGRRWLCKQCHGQYEWNLLVWILSGLPEEIIEAMRNSAQRFAKQYFTGGNI